VSIFHLDGRHKHQENSDRGIYRAHQARDDEIDLDMMPDRYGNIYGCHWPEPMIHDGFRDTRHVLDPSTRLDQMTPADVGRLVAGWWPLQYRIRRIEHLLGTCAHIGIGARLEPKHPIFLTKTPWEHLAAVGDDLGAQLRMYALPELDGIPDFGVRCVAAAHSAGIPGKVIGT
jgi:hypothetical protein